MNLKNDIVTMVAGAAGWAIAVPVVKLAGQTVAAGTQAHRAGAVVAGLGMSSVTTPLLGSFLNWKSSQEKVRGIALALGTAQVIDGLVHLFMPAFYSDKHKESIASAGNIFLAAGLLGIFSAYA